MGRNATGKKKEAVLRVRIEDDLDARIMLAMEKEGYQGTKESYTAGLVVKGLQVAEVAEAITKKAIQMVAESAGEYCDSAKVENRPKVIRFPPRHRLSAILKKIT